MAYTLDALIAELNPVIWPSGQAQNLVIPHRRLFIEALIDLQQFVECLRINNTQVVPQCNTMFDCGKTVFDAPRGRINRIYVIDKINQTTGREDPEAPADWCSAVNYRQVEYADLHRYVSQTLAGTWGGCGCWGWANLSELIAFPTCWQTKYRSYPPPTDYGLGYAPPLPMGLHYAQTSTDEPNGIRAQWGMWALRGGLIYLAPWIQSTETVIIEWDGIKRVWNPLDLVDDDPLLKKAVEDYVRWKDNEKYLKDFDAASASQAEYLRSSVPNLIYECRQETVIRDAARATTSAARGAAQIIPTFTNEAQQATAACPTNMTGQPVTATVPAGSVVSTVSQADANAMAQSQALQLAGQQLNCTEIPVTYFSSTQSYTANCPIGGTGAPVTITIEAGTYSSIISQADADAQALAAATQAALLAISCTFLNTQQTYTAVCPDGHPGADVTVTIAAGQYSSTVSQADANAKALAAATTQAISQLVCADSPTIYYNTEQNLVVHKACIIARPGHPTAVANLTANVTVNAGQFTSQVSQADANQQAINYGNLLGNAQLTNQCSALGGH